MKSKTNAMMTIAMTYEITSMDASRVLQRDALQHLRDAHAAVGGPLERVVHLFPFEHIERIGMAREEIAYRRVIDRVGLLFELLDVASLDAHELRLTDRRHTDLDVLGGVNE